MKKRLGLIYLCFCLIVQLCACNRSSTLIDLSAFGGDFYAEHSALFYNVSCEHDLRYQNMPEALAEDNATIYHKVSCYYGNCDFEAHLEPHTVDPTKLTIIDKPTVKENGCLYHKVAVNCEFCEVYPYFYIYVLCPRQDKDCRRENVCLDGADWREILCDTPYVILYD